MRTNVYDEELTDDAEVITKTTKNQTFIGVRFYLKTHPALWNTPSGDARSAITVWFRDRASAERLFMAATHAVKQSLDSFRQLAKTHHPDMGGNLELWQRLLNARDNALDELKRIVMR